MKIFRDKYSETALDRFLDKVMPEPNSGCWLWTGSTTRSGHASFNYRTGVSGPAYRFSYEWFCGEIPDGLVIDHLCKVNNCVNPDHLEPVTQRENLLRNDRHNIGRVAQLGVCCHGHPATSENRYAIPGTNKTSCRVCNRLAARKRRELV